MLLYQSRSLAFLCLLVLAAVLAPRWRDRFQKLNAEHYDTGIRLQRAGSAGVAAVQAMMGLGLAALAFLTGRALLRGEITEGQFLSFLGTLYLMQVPAVDIGQRVGRLVSDNHVAGTPGTLYRFDGTQRLGPAGTVTPAGDALSLDLPQRSATLVILSTAGV